mgnify:CR=1 FL=1
MNQKIRLLSVSVLLVAVIFIITKGVSNTQQLAGSMVTFNGKEEVTNHCPGARLFIDLCDDPVVSNDIWGDVPVIEDDAVMCWGQWCNSAT